MHPIYCINAIRRTTHYNYPSPCYHICVIEVGSYHYQHSISKVQVVIVVMKRQLRGCNSKTKNTLTYFPVKTCSN